MAPGPATSTKTSCASHLAPVLSIGLSQILGFSGLFWRDSGCDTIKADSLEVLPIAIPERTRFADTVERGYLELLDFAVDMLLVRDALTPFLQSMAELLNASHPSDEARKIRIPLD